MFVDDIADVPPGRPIMLSAHGSAPEVVAAARARGSYVVDSVCPLVTKVHHEVKVRAGKGYRIVYVGHEGHEEAVGTMAVAPESISRVESGRRGRRARPQFDEPVALLAQTTLSHRDWAGVAVAVTRRVPRRVDAGPQRPVLRHHQPPVGADGDGAAVRRDRGDRLGQLVQHPGAREAGRSRPGARGCSASTTPTSCPTTCTARSASPPARRRPRSSSTRSCDCLAPRHGVEAVKVTDEDEYFPPPRNIRDLQAAIGTAAAAMLGGSVAQLGDDERPRLRRQRRARRPGASLDELAGVDRAERGELAVVLVIGALHRGLVVADRIDDQREDPARPR